MNDLAYTSQQYIFRNPALREPKAASQSMINKLINDNKKTAQQAINYRKQDKSKKRNWIKKGNNMTQKET